MKQFFKKLWKFITSKIFLISLCLLIMLILSVLFWIYAPLLTFNENYLFASPSLKIIVLCCVWIPTLIVLTYKQIKHLLSEKIIQKRKNANLIKTEASTFFARTRRNFSLALKDAKRTWRKTIKFNKLPLVIVMGEEGAGKSSFINYAGLEYPISDALGSYKQHHLSTKNFTFYITKKGALIDTEGSYFSFENFFIPTNTDEIPEDDMQKNKEYLLKKTIWNRFVGFLKKMPFYKNLNGMIYIIDIQYLLNSPKEEMHKGIYSLVKRIRECESKLNLKLPIYIVFTKLDLIEGMGEFLKLYSENLSQKTLGVTFPLKFSFSPEALHHCFEGISQSLKSALMSKNGLNLTLQAKAQSYLFFKQLENLFALTEEFLQETHHSNSKNKSFIRGVYFVSSYQENLPNNFLLSSVCHQYNIKAPISKNRTQMQKQSYFVKSLLEDIIFRDVGLSQTIFGSLWKKISACLIGLVAVGITFYLTNYLITQRQIQQKNLQNSANQVEIAIDDLQIRYSKASISKKSFYIQNLKNILSFYPQIFTQHSYLDYPTLNLAYQAFNPAKELFLQKSEDLLSLTLLEEFQTLLLQEKQPEKLLIVLYLYRTMFDRHYLKKELLISWIKENWFLFRKYEIPQEVMIGYIQDLGQVPYWKYQENKKAIQEAKKHLTKITRSQRLYTLLSLRANDSQGVFNLRTEIGGSFDEVFNIGINSYLVPKSYTKSGAISLMGNINKYIDETIQIESWLLGEQVQIQSTEGKEKIALSMDIVKLYAQEYAQRWQALLANVKPKPFASQSSGLGILGILSRPNNPVKSLIEVVSNNTQLLDGNDLINQAINIGLPVADFKNVFEALSDSFSVYHLVAKQDSLLTQGLNLAGEKLEAQPNVDAKLAQAVPKSEKVMKKIAEDMSAIYKKIISFSTGALSSQEKIFYALQKPSNPEDPFVILETDSKSLPAEIKDYYAILSSYAWEIIEEKGTKELDVVWNQELYAPFIDQIASTYPINPRSKTPLKLVAFKGFFGKQGVWDKFFTQYLSQILIKRGETYQVDPAYAKKLNFSQEFLNALTKITTISNGILDFNNNLDVKFGIKIIALSGDYGKLIIAYNDKQIEYDHTLTPTLEFVADAFSESTKLSITALDEGGNLKQKLEFSGQWAWMQMMQLASLKADTYKILFNQNPKLYFDFKVVSGRNSLYRAMEILPYLELPQNILK